MQFHNCDHNVKPCLTCPCHFFWEKKLVKLHWLLLKHELWSNLTACLKATRMLDWAPSLLAVERHYSGNPWAVYFMWRIFLSKWSMRINYFYLHSYNAHGGFVLRDLQRSTLQRSLHRVNSALPQQQCQHEKIIAWMYSVFCEADRNYFNLEITKFWSNFFNCHSFTGSSTSIVIRG